MYKKEGRDSSREAVKIMEKKITEEQPGYSALTDSRSTVKEKTDTELTEGIKKTKNELELPQHSCWSGEVLIKQERSGEAEQLEQEKNI